MTCTGRCWWPGKRRRHSVEVNTEGDLRLRIEEPRRENFLASLSEKWGQGGGQSAGLEVR